MFKTAHYNKDEFTCKCGCGSNLATKELLHLCELVRMLNGNIPLPVSSGTRCATYNEKVGGAPASKHVLGQAADLPVYDTDYVYDKLRKIFLYSHGLGLYNTFVHVDIREKKARW
jgi:uncharacterized protein YcbK (DUF882 family)